MLIDFLQESAEMLRSKKDEFRSLFREYKRFYSRDMLDELKEKKEEIGKIRSEVTERIYENLLELMLIKRYFPDLYGMLMDDEGVGEIIRRMDWMISRKEEKKDLADKRMNEIVSERKQLQEARIFVEKWPRPMIDAKSLVATWPVLKGLIHGDIERHDALSMIDKKEREIVKEGWSVLLNSSMIGDRLNLFIGRIMKLRIKENAMRMEVEKARGRGSVPEYDAMKEYEKAKRARERMERMCNHLLLANPQFLEKMKKELRTGKKNKTDLERMVEKTVVKKINETLWLKEMKKRLEME